MVRRVLVAVGLAALAGLGCSRHEAPAGASSASPPAALSPLSFIENDVPAALARARAERKAVFVDVWAPWCHTCLSMKNYVLVDPSLRPLAERVVFVAIDSDRPESAPFLERYAVGVWPTFFVIDPASERSVGLWPGAASAAELRSFVEDALHAIDVARSGAGADDAAAHLGRAREAHADRRYDQAVAEYEIAVAKAPIGSPRRSEALLGWIQALEKSGDVHACAKLGREHADEVQGAAIPADFAGFLLDCASKLSGAEQVGARAVALARLRKITESPPAEASADDRADALSYLADVLTDTGDPDGARRANEARVAIMEKAAASAPTPAIAATYDYGRAMAYVALGRGDDAVRMLEGRERELPDAYEPPARLASALAKLGRLPEALAAADRAIARAYGPRRLGYFKLKAEIQGRTGDHAGQIATLRAEVAGHEALPKGQVSSEKLADARRRLEEAERK